MAIAPRGAQGVASAEGLEVRREAKVWQQSYERGRPVAPIKVVGTARKTGTKVTFWPDPEIFTVSEFHFDSLSQRLRELSFLNPGVAISIRDERTEKKHDFAYEGGIKSFVEHLNKTKTPIHDKVIYFQDVREGTGDPRRDADKERVEVALQWNDGYAETVFAFTNTINNRDGGTHLEGYRTALTRALQKYADSSNLTKSLKETSLSGEDCREGDVQAADFSDTNVQGNDRPVGGGCRVEGCADIHIGAHVVTGAFGTRAGSKSRPVQIWRVDQASNRAA